MNKKNKSGSGNYLSFSYADEMDDLLDSRPICVQECIDSSSVDTQENNENINNWVYEDNPDPRDGAIPGCSFDCNSSEQLRELEENSLIASSASHEENSSIASSASTKTIKKKTPRNKSFGNMIKYADKLKENYEESQGKIMRETQDYIKNLIESEQKMQKEIIANSQRNILKETTNQLLTGLQDIFDINRNQDIFPKTVINPQSLNFSPFSYVNLHIEPQTTFHSNILSQTINSSNTLPKVLINLKRPSTTPINEQHNTEKLQKIDPKLIKPISKNNTESTNTKDLKEHE